MALHVLIKLTISAVLLCSSPADGYTIQGMYDCEFDNNTKDMVFFVKNVLNQELNTIYDSRVGKYVGFGEYGRRNADHFNSQAWKMALRRIQVETVCRYNVMYYKKTIIDRKVPPVVRVLQIEPLDYGELSMLECSVWGFFPQEVRVSWLKDGVEVPSDFVSSTDVMSNGDWSFQVHLYLEFIPRRGERVTCRVDHSSLAQGLEVDWDTSPLDAKHIKMAVGIIFFFTGFFVAVGGVAYYRWKKTSDFTALSGQDRTPL